MNIDKKVAVELASCRIGEEVNGIKVVQNEIIDHGRWNILYYLVVEIVGAFYATSYSIGATESQDEGPFEYENGPIVFKEVFAVEKTIIVYEERK